VKRVPVILTNCEIKSGYRAITFVLAADIADRAFTKELDRTAWATANSKIAAYAVELCDAVMRLDPVDISGEHRERRAWALFCSGRIAEAKVRRMR